MDIMDIIGFEKIAPYLTHPLVLVGFVVMLAFGIHKVIVQSKLLSKINSKDSGMIIKLILLLGLFLVLAVLGLVAWNSYMDKEKVVSVDAGKLAREMVGPLQGQLDKKDEQIKALTDAITALSKTGAPAASINAALQELEQGNTAKAQAIFAEVLKTKEAEGKQANKEAAAAARHLGALAYMNDTKAALAAYQKAVELDPDNADGWNQLGLLLKRTGEFAQAEQMHKKAFEINEHSGCKEGLACASINLGNVHFGRGEIDKAEQSYKAALEISLSLGDKNATVKAYTNLGTMHAERGDLDQAEQWYRKGLEMSQDLGDKSSVTKLYINLGIVCNMRGDLNQAEQLYRKALELSQLLEDNETLSNLYGSLGNLYTDRGELDNAEGMYRKALELNQTLGCKEGMAKQYGNLGFLYEKRGDLDKAEEIHRNSLRLFQEMGHPDAKKAQRLLDELARKKADGSR